MEEKRKIKIGIDCHNLEGNRTGVGRYLQNILENFCQIEGLESKFLFYLYFKKEIPNDDFLKDSKIFISKITKISKFKASFLLHYFLLIPFYYKKDKLDLFWFPCYMVPHTFRGNAILTIHDLIYERYPETVPFRYRIFYKIFSKYGAKYSKKILTVSEFSKREIEYFYKVKPEKIEAIHLGVAKKFDAAFKVSKESALEKIREKYNIKKRYILYLGQIFARRHPEEMIKAFYNIAENFKDCQFLIVGKNWTDIEIDKLCKNFNQKLKRQVFLRIDYAQEQDMIYLYKGADLFIYLSDYEGFGMPPLEAQRCGTPVVSSCGSSLNEVLKESALLIKDNTSINEIGRAYFKILSDKKFLQDLIKKGLKNSLRFDFEKTSVKTFEVIKKLCLKNY